MDNNILDTLLISLFAPFSFDKGNDICWCTKEKMICHDAICEYFEERGMKIHLVFFDENASIFGCSSTKEEYIYAEEVGYEKYAYVIVDSTMECIVNPQILLKNIKEILAQNGTLFLALNNSLGLRYLIGDRDPYTNRNFDSIESYGRFNAYDKKNIPGMMRSRNEIDEILMELGWSKSVQFSVFPNLEHPQLIYREDYLPREDISSRIMPIYNSPHTIFLDEYSLLKKLRENGMFHQFANSFILECSLDNKHEDLLHATINMVRGRKNAMATLIRENGIVEKKAIFAEGQTNIMDLKSNHDSLKSRGINVTEVVLEGNTAQSCFVQGPSGIEYFSQLFKRGEFDKIIDKVDEFKNIILKSSKQVIEDDSGEVLLEEGYIDLTLINCVYRDDEPIFFDQEYVIKNLPAKVLIKRLIDYVYFGENVLYSEKLPKELFYEKYALNKEKERWQNILSSFMEKLKNENTLRPYYEQRCTSSDIINTNRQRMNYSQAEYDRLFNQIFKGLENKKLYLFGSGNFAARFINLYGRFYKPAGIIDNNAEKWGRDIEGIKISSIAELTEKKPDDYKVIICIKNFTAVLKQLKELGVKNISVFDPNGIYDVDRSLVNSTNKTVNNSETDYTCEDKEGSSEACPSKKYNVGYIAGVFDLFHIGHLNLLRRAKEQCNHLIVGVVNDEAVIKNKKVEPFVPFEERIEMVRSCKYVDEAVEITYTNAGTRDAFRMYHFDVQFSGSDYVYNGAWLAEKEFLEKNGAELVFFPYTEQTSSSKIKKLIEEKLI